MRFAYPPYDVRLWTGAESGSNVGWVSVVCVTHQALRSNTTHLVKVCLAAPLVGYGANSAPNPPYI